MSARAVNVSALVAHVPVDHFTIVDGPGAIVCMRAMGQLTDRAVEYVDILFTLNTAASISIFRRTLKVATIFAVEGNTFNFTAIFSGRVVSGVYDMKACTGWFNLD